MCIGIEPDIGKEDRKDERYVSESIAALGKIEWHRKALYTPTCLHLLNGMNVSTFRVEARGWKTTFNCPTSRWPRDAYLVRTSSVGRNVQVRNLHLNTHPPTYAKDRVGFDGKKSLLMSSNLERRCRKQNTNCSLTFLRTTGMHKWGVVEVGGDCCVVATWGRKQITRRAGDKVNK